MPTCANNLQQVDRFVRFFFATASDSHVLGDSKRQRIHSMGDQHSRWCHSGPNERASRTACSPVRPQGPSSVTLGLIHI